MLDKLDFLVRYWQLCMSLGGSSAAVRPEFASLLRRVNADVLLPEAGPAPHVARGVPLQIEASVGLVAGELRMVCAEGVVVACAAPLAARQQAVVHLADAVSGVEYTLPCVVEWVWPGEAPALGLRIDGPPRRASFMCLSAGPAGPPWQDAPPPSDQPPGTWG